MKTELMRVTPALAARWMKENNSAGNRNLSDATVAAYAADMAAGAWQLSHQGIAFAEDGRLIDGQHRLTAIMKSGVAVMMLVTTGLPRTSQEVFDAPRVRTVADRLGLLGENSPSRLAARCSVIRAIEDGIGHNTRYTLAQTQATAEEHREGLDWAETVFGGRATGISAPISGALAWCYPAARHAIDAFGKQVRSGEGLFEGDPALTLRRHLVGVRRQGTETRSWLIRGAIRAAYASIMGEKITRLFVRAGERGEQKFEEALEFFRRERARGNPIP